MTSNPQQQPKKPLNGYAKYLSMATYMAVIITLGTLGGRWLDQHAPISQTPIWTLILSLFSVFAAMWYFIRDFLKPKK
ncbi:MAG: AtpZ/AtpI family protein [Bacteroidia bacterium]